MFGDITILKADGIDRFPETLKDGVCVLSKLVTPYFQSFDIFELIPWYLQNTRRLNLFSKKLFPQVSHLLSCYHYFKNLLKRSFTNTKVKFQIVTIFRINFNLVSNFCLINLFLWLFKRILSASMNPISPVKWHLASYYCKKFDLNFKICKYFIWCSTRFHFQSLYCFWLMAIIWDKL